MDTGLLLRGIVVGFVVAAPVGPVGVLCIRRTLTEGRFSGFVSGLGAASADAVYGYVTAFGLSVVAALLAQSEAWLRLVGGAFLVALGVKIFLENAPPGKQPRPGGAGSWALAPRRFC